MPLWLRNGGLSGARCRFIFAFYVDGFHNLSLSPDLKTVLLNPPRLAVPYRDLIFCDIVPVDQKGLPETRPKISTVLHINVAAIAVQGGNFEP